MLRLLSRVFSRAWQPLVKPDPAARRAFQKALDQEAVFQMEDRFGGNSSHNIYLTPKSLDGHGIMLTTKDPYFMVAASWEKQVRPFRFLIQVLPGKPLLLHKFQGRIIRVENKRTIVVALPKHITALERRRSLRLRPKSVHAPNIIVWGIYKDQEEGKVIRLNHHVILDVAQREEAYRAILNISSRGIRLALDSHVFNRNQERLEPNRRLIVQLVFENLPGKQSAKHMFVAKVCNHRVEGVSRPEVGIQFLAVRVQHPTPRWQPLENNGCESLAKVIQALEVLYYTQVKQRVAH